MESAPRIRFPWHRFEVQTLVQVESSRRRWQEQAESIVSKSQFAEPTFYPAIFGVPKRLLDLREEAIVADFHDEDRAVTCEIDVVLLANDGLHQSFMGWVAVARERRSKLFCLPKGVQKEVVARMMKSFKKELRWEHYQGELSDSVLKTVMDDWLGAYESFAREIEGRIDRLMIKPKRMRLIKKRFRYYELTSWGDTPVKRSILSKFIDELGAFIESAQSYHDLKRELEKFGMAFDRSKSIWPPAGFRNRAAVHSYELLLQQLAREPMADARR